MSKRFSIIIPVHNAEEFIIKALESVESQKFKEYELLVIDDHSTDKSKELVEEYMLKNKESDIRLYQTEKGKWGPGAARNIGLDNSNGEYVLFLDSDDELNNDMSLKNINEAIEKNDLVEALVLGFQRKWRDRNDKVLFTSTFKPQEIHVDKHYQIGRNNEGTIWSGCWKRSLFDNNGIRFPENCVWEDLIPKMQLFNAADSEKIKVCGYSTHTYNVRPGKSVGSTPSMEKLKAMIDLHRKCANLVKDGKIDEEFDKDIKTRLRNSPMLLAWMIGMKAYTMAFKTIPDGIDSIKEKIFNTGKEQER